MSIEKLEAQIEGLTAQIEAMALNITGRFDASKSLLQQRFDVMEKSLNEIKIDIERLENQSKSFASDIARHGVWIEQNISHIGKLEKSQGHDMQIVFDKIRTERAEINRLIESETASRIKALEKEIADRNNQIDAKIENSEKSTKLWLLTAVLVALAGLFKEVIQNILR